MIFSKRITISPNEVQLEEHLTRPLKDFLSKIQIKLLIQYSRYETNWCSSATLAKMIGLPNPETSGSSQVRRAKKKLVDLKLIVNNTSILEANKEQKIYKEQSVVYLTNKGNEVLRSILGKRAKINSDVDDDSASIPKPKYSDFDFETSKWFEKEMKANLALKGLPSWTPSWAEELRKIREKDGFTEEEILKTLEFVLQDPFYLKNFRSLASARNKWKNGMTKFASAAAEVQQSENQETKEDPIILPPKNLVRIETYDKTVKRQEVDLAQKYCKALMDLPRPAYGKSNIRLRQWKKMMYDLSILFEEFEVIRLWNIQNYFEEGGDKFHSYNSFLRKKNPYAEFFTEKEVRENLKTFFKELQCYNPDSIGMLPKKFKTRNEDNSIREDILLEEDRTWQSRIDFFNEHQPKGEDKTNITERYFYKQVNWSFNRGYAN